MWKKRERVAQDSRKGARGSKGPSTLLSWREVEKIVQSISFRDWNIDFVYSAYRDMGTISVTGYFPNRDTDIREGVEDSERRWYRSRRQGTRYMESEHQLYGSLGSSYDSYASRETYFAGAAPVAGWRDVPEYARESEHTLIRHIYGMILALSDHEIRENLYVSGERVLDPHIYGFERIEDPSLPFI